MTKQKNQKKTQVFNPLEQIVELGKDTVKRAGEEMVNIVNPFPEIWGSPTPKPESMPGGPNFSPVDFDKLNENYQNQDNPDIAKIREQLMMQQNGGQKKDEQPQMSEEQAHLRRHREVKREEEEYNAKKEQEEAEAERQEEMEKQQAEAQEQEQLRVQQQQSSPQGKVRKSVLGGGKKRANMDLPPEVRSERKGGAGKY